jgi:heme-degrading monooxygenase HmoA
MSVIEVVRFRLAAGTDEKTFLAADRVAEEQYISRQPGFAGRETARADDGSWLVVIRWDSRDAAEAAIAGFADAPASKGFLTCVDPSSTTAECFSVIAG